MTEFWNQGGIGHWWVFVVFDWDCLIKQNFRAIWSTHIAIIHGDLCVTAPVFYSIQNPRKTELILAAQPFSIPKLSLGLISIDTRKTSIQCPGRMGRIIYPKSDVPPF